MCNTYAYKITTLYSIQKHDIHYKNQNDLCVSNFQLLTNLKNIIHLNKILFLILLKKNVNNNLTNNNFENVKNIHNFEKN